MVSEIFKKIDLKQIKSLSTEEILKRAYQIGFEYERTRYGCSQSVVAAIENVFGFDFPDLVKSSYPLAGGVATTTEGTCGALSGGVLIIGYLFGRSREEFKKNVFNRKALFISKPLYDKFIQEYDTCICKGIQKKIFNPYFTTKSEKNGTGLGLYMSKLLIEDKCNGNIHVVNSNKGALFTVVLPK